MLQYTLKIISVVKDLPNKLPEKVEPDDVISLCTTVLTNFVSKPFNQKEVDMLHKELFLFCKTLLDENRYTINQFSNVHVALDQMFEMIEYTDTRGDEFLKGMHYIYDNRNNSGFGMNLFNDLSSRVLLSTVYEYNEIMNYFKSPDFIYNLMSQINFFIEGMAIGKFDTSNVGNVKDNRLEEFACYCKIAELLGLYNKDDSEDRKRFLLKCAAMHGVEKSNNSDIGLQLSDNDMRIIKDTTNLFEGE